MADVKPAMKLALERRHIIAEGAASCALAAALAGRVRGTVVAVVSGGTIDPDAFASLVPDRRGVDIGPTS